MKILIHQNNRIIGLQFRLSFFWKFLTSPPMTWRGNFFATYDECTERIPPYGRNDAEPEIGGVCQQRQSR